jgi:hypothetical protein
MSDDVREQILRQTALKFYPKATEVSTGAKLDPWVKLFVDGVRCEVHVSRSIALESFEEEAWQQFARLRTDLKMNDVAEIKTDVIVIDNEEPV